MEGGFASRLWAEALGGGFESRLWEEALKQDLVKNGVQRTPKPPKVISASRNSWMSGLGYGVKFQFCPKPVGMPSHGYKTLGNIILAPQGPKNPEFGPFWSLWSQKAPKSQVWVSPRGWLGRLVLVGDRPCIGPATSDMLRGLGPSHFTLQSLMN